MKAVWLVWIFVWAGVGFPAACKQAEKKDKDDSSDSSSSTVSGASSGGAGSSAAVDTDVPQVGAISLEHLGVAAAGLRGMSLLDEGGCDQATLGVMGFALGGACNTAPFVSQIMLGSRDGDFDGDGDTDCADLKAAKDAGKEPGILLSLLCEDAMLATANVTSLAFATGKTGPNEAFAVSFKDFQNDVPAVGTWTHGSTESYPADIRIFRGSSLDALAGHVAMSLTDPNNGSVKLAGFGTNAQFTADLAFSNKAQVSACAASPSTATCHWQDIRIYGGEGSTADGPPNGFHLKIFADSKAAPTFLALEGKYRYTAATAAALTAGQSGCPGGELPKLRTAYFQTVQHGGQIWGRFYFLDENGLNLTCNLGGVDPFALLARPEGICQNPGSDAWVTCEAIDYTLYTDMWQGEAAFNNVTESPVSDDVWANPPTASGLCTSSGCNTMP